MGLASSQARLLGIGSKKYNAEWQGQQINQTRTALANQTAELWQELFQMEAPNAPKITNYSTTQYSFSDGNTTYEIDSIDSKSSAGKYNAKVTYKYYQDSVEAVEKVNDNPQVQESSSSEGISIKKLPSGSYLVTKNGESMIVNDIADVSDPEIKEALVEKGVIKTVNDEVTSFVDANGQVQYLAGVNKASVDNSSMAIDAEAFSINYKVGTSDAVAADKSDEDVQAQLQKILEYYPDSEIAKAIQNNEAIYTYSKNGVINYACIDDLEKSMYSSNTLNGQKPMHQYVMRSFQQKIIKTDDAIVEMNSSGRYRSIALKDYSDVEFSLHTESTTDNKAYELAMQEYVAYKNRYEARVEWINSKTKEIQEQDRTLELRLHQLDTERTSLQTEMETIKKIMEKKVDEVFKTYQ